MRLNCFILGILITLIPLYSLGQDTLDIKCYTKEELSIIARSNLERINCEENYAILLKTLTYKDSVLLMQSNHISELTTHIKSQDSILIYKHNSLYTCSEKLEKTKTNSRRYTVTSIILLIGILCLL